MLHRLDMNTHLSIHVRLVLALLQVLACGRSERPLVTLVSVPDHSYGSGTETICLQRARVSHMIIEGCVSSPGKGVARWKPGNDALK